MQRKKDQLFCNSGQLLPRSAALNTYCQIWLSALLFLYSRPKIHALRKSIVYSNVCCKSSDYMHSSAEILANLHNDLYLHTYTHSIVVPECLTRSKTLDLHLT